MSERAVIYARVSTRTQEEEGYGLDYQVADCRTYADSLGFNVTEILKDDVSGTTRLEERNGGNQLLSLVTGGEVDAVIVWRLDRLSRPPRGEYSRLLTTIEHFGRFGVSVHDCDGGENDPMQLAGGLMAFIKSYQASRERETIRERTLKGKKERAKSGKWVGMFPPYGYDKVGERKNARLVINEQEAAIVRRIFEHYVGWGGRRMMPVRAIAKMLNDEGVPTPGSKRNMKTMGVWRISAIRERIIKNPRYIGKVKSAGFVLDLPELAIIDPVLFEEAQKLIQLNKRRHHSGNPKRYYLMSGRFCCLCGRGLVGANTSVTNAKGEKVYYPYYRCAGVYGDGPRECNQGNLKADEIDALAWEWVVGLLKDDLALDEGLDELERRSKETIEPASLQLETIELLIVKNENRIRRLVEAFGKAEDPTVSDAMQDQINLSVKQKESLVKEHERLELKLASAEIDQELRDRIKELARQIRKRLGKATEKDKLQLLDTLGVEGRLIQDDEGRLAIKLSCILDTQIFRREVQEP